MPEGLEYDPEAVRAYAEVFTQASAQLEQVGARLGQTSATAADFGRSWSRHGDDFETSMAAIAEDLTTMATKLGAVGDQLTHGRPGGAE